MLTTKPKPGEKGAAGKKKKKKKQKRTKKLFPPYWHAS